MKKPFLIGRRCSLLLKDQGPVRLQVHDVVSIEYLRRHEPRLDK
jgi:hypothetical protein